MKKEWTYLQVDGRKWKASHLSESVILLETKAGIDYTEIHSLADFIKQCLKSSLKDIVPAYQSIAMCTDLTVEEVVSRLDGQKTTKTATTTEVIKLPICYELGLDLDELAEQLSLTKESIIAKHLAGIYTSAFIGFSPGFVYAEGLHPSLAFPRRSSPRKQVEAGSVGIGGSQTGIYSINSPGGWNIIGRTPVQLLNPAQQPPVLLPIGTRFSFFRITQKEFETWEN